MIKTSIINDLRIAKALAYFFLFTASLPSFSAQNSKNVSCMVSEFKMIAYTNNNPSVREEMAKQWLLTKGVICNQTQLRIIQSYAPSWLGTSLSNELSIIMDSLQEAKINGDSTKLLELYMPAVKNYESTVESISNPKARAPIVTNAGGGVIVGGVVAINNTINEKDNEKEPPPQKFPLGSRGTVASFFDELRGDKECPSFMKIQVEMCVTVRPNRTWKLGESLDGQSLTSEIPLKLRERLGNPPANHKYIQINEDILLVNEKSNIVTDMILDLGGIKAKKPQPQVDPKPKK